MENKEIALQAAKAIDEKKGQDIVIIDISGISGFADYFIVTHASSDRLMRTISEEVEDRLASLDTPLKRIEGKNGSGWILMDFGDIIVNIFTKEQRDRYNIEKIWGDGEITTYESTSKTEDEE